MEHRNYYTLEEIEDEFIGKKGTIKRDEYEADIKAFMIGDAIKKARLSKNMTQQQLGELIGVQRAQISKIESGKNLTFANIVRVFKAMGVTANLDLGSLGKVALY
ncbi:XRE family transcriptional regulator [Palleniella muris]|uniref:XRE family transcriptional regulator n=1 Tax=Palleniella muris TaxID=3038145 RepID=A0AC61QQF8_9BACT|nr:helix-turn-helix transcriptional regulator [Palleniella muris]TGX82257.1 XRE family transcriptional regulator [Palleniella muris]